MPSAHERASMVVQPVAGSRWAVTVLIPMVAVLNVAVSWGLWNLAYLDGASGVTYEDERAAADRVAALNWGYLGALAAAGVAFVVWLVRARANAERLCYAPHTRGAGWAVGSWIVPVVNLWFPYQVVRDVWKASDPRNRAVDDLAALPGSPLVDAWWSLWLVALAIDRLSVFLVPDVVAAMRHLAIWQTVSSVLQVAAAVAVLRVIARISGWQERARRDYA